MRIVGERICRRWEGTGASVLLIWPRFPETAEGYGALTDFYRRLAEAVETYAVARDCAVLGEMTVACQEDTFFSLVLDLLAYRGSVMTDCRRVCDTRSWEGLALPPPRWVRRRIPRGGGWYFDGEHYRVYENTFTPERGSGVRRSGYRVFLPETVL